MAFIDTNREDFGVEPICTVLRSAGVQVAPSTYYAAHRRAPSVRAVRDAVMTPILVALFDDNCQVYGVRKLHKAAVRVGHGIGRDQVGWLMRTAGIAGVRRGKQVGTTRPEGGAAAPGPGQT